MLLLIGGAFGSDLNDLINGAVVSLRVKGDRIALWLKKIEDSEQIKTIGMKLKDLLGLTPFSPILYEVDRHSRSSPSLFIPLFSTMNNRSMTFD